MDSLKAIGGAVIAIIIGLIVWGSTLNKSPQSDIEQSLTSDLHCGRDADCNKDSICNRGQCINPNAIEAISSNQTEGSQPENSTSVSTDNAQTEHSAPATTDRADEAMPKFKDYPSGAEYTGPAAELVLDNELAINFRTRLNEALYEKPVFAGEYVSATWGCGTSCTTTVFVNKRTGKTLNEEFGGELGSHLTAVKVNSNLLVAEGVVYDKEGNDTGDYEAYFYVLEGEQLKLIKTVSIPRPEDLGQN